MPEVKLENGINPASATPEEIQAYIDIATGFLVDILSHRGQTLEGWREFRNNTIASEQAFIAEELQRLEDNAPVE